MRRRKKGIQTRLKFDSYLSTRLIRNVVKYGSEKSSQTTARRAEDSPKFTLQNAGDGSGKEEETDRSFKIVN
jgi:hypothetical protein